MKFAIRFFSLSYFVIFVMVNYCYPLPEYSSEGIRFNSLGSLEKFNGLFEEGCDRQLFRNILFDGILVL